MKIIERGGDDILNYGLDLSTGFSSGDNLVFFKAVRPALACCLLDYSIG
jgi:hypothetical protein